MTINVPWLNTEDIEKETEILLESYEAKFGKIETIETPIEEIIELHLQLTFEVTDLGDDDILGLIDIENKCISINRNLDIIKYPYREGRYNYTLAHETGHWCLHRTFVEEMSAPTLFDEQGQKVILCRQSEKKERIEVQADMFSSYLLMPKHKIFEQYEKFMGTGRTTEVSEYLQRLRWDTAFMDRVSNSVSGELTDDVLLQHAFSDLAKIFKVSREPMVIRLKELKLLTMDGQRQLVF